MTMAHITEPFGGRRLDTQWTVLKESRQFGVLKFGLVSASIGNYDYEDKSDG